MYFFHILLQFLLKDIINCAVHPEDEKFVKNNYTYVPFSPEYKSHILMSLCSNVQCSLVLHVIKSYTHTHTHTHNAQCKKPNYFSHLVTCRISRKLLPTYSNYNKVCYVLILLCRLFGVVCRVAEPERVKYVCHVIQADQSGSKVCYSTCCVQHQ